ncbi:ABC transporter permease [Microbacterium sp. SSW1-49]|uniref:ABC transporter permease n=1 Tax=Microbacterium croceum TaxID=2851645 RepID=A0ABT0FII3_9MICO|nr:ABC transporter permease [Microbacterium croceum]MCK2037867.1 ABC transporter permease [Microbacterium croceum]
MTAARIRRNPLSSIALMLLIAISAATAGAGVFALTSSIGATERLFRLAQAPDAVQMHVGPLDPDALDAFAEANPDIVRDHQVQVALQLDNLALRVDGESDVARAGVMDLLLVTQSPRFDLLLDAEGEPVTVRDGQIAVPSYYASAYELAPGDMVDLVIDGAAQPYTVSDVIQDAQMGPSLVNSKRFVVSADDWQRLSGSLPPEHILTFRLVDGAGDRFAEAYRLAQLPANGAAVDGSLLRLITALSDGLVAIVTILVSLILLSITLLCLRIMVLTALEEDARRIGVLRAIGFSHRDVRGTLLIGYAVHAAAGSIVALFLVWPVSSLLTSTGSATLTGPQGGFVSAATIITVVITSILPVLVAAQLLRGIRRISPLAALTRPQVSPQTGRRPRRLRWDLPTPVTLRLALRGLTSRPGAAVLLIAMVACAVTLSALPLRVTQTIAAPDFVTVMGVGQSDIRAFVREGVESSAPGRLERSLADDPDIDRFASATSYRVDVVAGSHRETIALEAGDTSLFPVAYVHGTAPRHPGEIALSTLAAETAGVGVGQSVDVISDDTSRSYRVTAVYHDITNGGRSGKTASFDEATGVPLWRTVLIDVREGVDQHAKATSLSGEHPAASFTELDRFVQYTLGDTVERMQAASMVAGGSAAVVMLLVFALRGRLESARDEADLRLLRLLGWSGSAVRAVPMLRTVTVAALGLLLGAIATEALGPSVLGAMLSSFGGGATALAPPDVLPVMTAASVAAAVLAGTLIASFALPTLRNES